MNIKIDTTAAKFPFKPVNVSRGRSFRGFGYYVGEAGISQPAYCVTIYKVAIWNPVEKRIAYVNSDYLEDIDVDQAKIDADCHEYVNNVVNSTIAWCESQRPNGSQTEILGFARNVLRKRHPEFNELLGTMLTTADTAVVEIEKTLTWAKNLTTRACYMYGKWCAGGKPISNDRKIKAARTVLERKGITKLEGFEDAWNMSLVMFGFKSA